MDKENDSQKLARIDERTLEIKKAFDHHTVEDTRRFEMVFSHFNDRFDKFEEKVTSAISEAGKAQSAKVISIETRVSSLWDERNKQEGAYGVKKWVVGTVGGFIGSIITAAISFYMNQHGGSPGGKM